MSTLVASFADVYREHPARPVIHVPADDRTVTATDLWTAHLAVADRLARIGVEAGRVVVAAVGNTPALPAVLLACRALDAAMLPVDPGATRTETDSLSRRFGAAALVTADAVAAVEADARQYPGAAVLKLTSGSTGAPRATCTTEAQLVADGTHIIEAMDIRADDTQIAAIPLSHSYGLGNLLLPLLLQGTACVLRESFVPQLLTADAHRFGARVLPGVPFMFQYFVDSPPDRWPPTLQRLISAGAPLAPATLRAFHDRFGVKIHSFYGASETGGITFDAGDEIDDSGTVGAPLPGVTVTLRDANTEQSAGTQQSAISNQQFHGRVHVSSAAVCSGYADEASDTFVDGGFLTGDDGEWDSRGRLLLRGRVSSFVNVAGRKVHPDEVEAVLRAMPGVVDVRVLAAEDRRRGQQIVACIVADARASTITTLAVRRFCAERLASHKIPRAIVLLDALPITARGKIDRHALAALVRAHLGV